MPRAANGGAAPAKRGQPNDSHCLQPTVAQPPMAVNVIVLTELQLQAMLDGAARRAVETATKAGPRLLDLSSLGRELGLSAPSIRKLIDEGLPFLRCGQLKRFDLGAVCSWLAARRTAPSVELVPELEAS